jgi:spermidine synthase
LSWFDETLYSEWSHRGFMQRFEISRILHQTNTSQQNLIVFETPMFGRVLAIDGIIQTTERDEFIYHEMLVHVPLLAHGEARRILIIGGGDGGALREVLRHPDIELARMVEIDPGVIDISRQFLPGLSQGAFDDARADLVINDGSGYVKNCAEKFDVILIDSTDPIGPGEVLFSEEFYGDCREILADGGILVAQCGVPFSQAGELTASHQRLSGVFKHAAVYLVAVPTYVGGAMAFALAADSPAPKSVDGDALAHRFHAAGFATRYYSPDIHRAAFALPPYIQALLA